MQVFARVVGQEDNIGDIVLRRQYLQTAASYGSLHLFAGEHSAAYLESLQFPDAKYYSSHRLWWSAMLSAAKQGPVLLFDKPGELQTSWRSVRSQLKSHLRRRLLTRRGGRTVLLGVGLRHSLPLLRRIALRAAFSDYLLIGWRDVRSHKELGVGQVMPDWAFAEEATNESEGDRNLLIVSMRGDRPSPSARWFNLLGEFAQRHGLQVQVVTQVGRDETRSGEIAARLGVAPMPWMTGDYAAQERALRTLYQRARLVVSDRMHVLIVAANEGAVPLCLTDWPEEKIERHFQAIGFEDVSSVLPSTDDAAARLLDQQITRTEELSEKRAAAKGAIREMEARLQKIVRAGDRR
ncbi:polysaccharide pyruvyl transferase family protein [Croceibacterium sp. TMG7-5b_MA50]|uniref:polysaccharide pyruvyl transferase family protein n=1 Tax=Croceibacterium sp. TMG7-5b_MA50 TaxID=3121290 RepID=UPI003221E2C1